MKVVETKPYISALRELTEAGKEVPLLISGNSMAPFLIHERDTIFFRKPERRLKKGDIVFFQRRDGTFVLHRIYRVRPEGFYIVGDAQTAVEGPVMENQIFAVVTKVRRKGKLISYGDFWWDFFAYVWIRMLPLRRPVLKAYSWLRGKG